MTNHSEESPPLSEQQPQSPKTLTLETPLPQNSDPQFEDNDQDDLELLTPVAQPTAPTRRPSIKRKKLSKQKRRGAIQGKKSTKKVENLKQTLKLIPFKPNKTLDFSRHEPLLKRLGLWDFLHLEFDPNIRTDLIAQLFANYNFGSRGSYVNGTKIRVNRADLSRALKLPLKKDKSNVNMNVSDGSAELCEKESEESIGFMEEVVSNWMLLHEDTWMMPQDILNWMKMIKEGNFEKICWASLVWHMVEKELKAPKLENCYYASHLQCLIKWQKEELLREELKEEEELLKEEVKEEAEEVREEVKEEEEEAREEVKVEEEGAREEVKEEEEEAREEVKEEEEEVREEVEEVKDEEEEDCDGDVKMLDGVDDVKTTEMEEHKIELSLGGENVVNPKEDLGGENVVNPKEDLGGENVVNLKEDVEKEEKEQELVGNDDVINFGENKNEEQQGQWLLLDGKSDVVENDNFLRGCTLGDVKVMDCEEENKQEVGEDLEDEGEEEDEEEEEEEGQEQEQHEGGFTLSPGGGTLEMVTSANLIQGMEAVQNPFSAGIQICDDDLPGEFLSSRADNNTIPGGSSSHFGNGNKREIDPENEVAHGSNKRLRTGGSWGNKSSDFHMCIEQIQHWMGKVAMMYENKEQACEESNVNQQFLINELQKRDNMIEHLHKAKLEEQHKRQVEVYKLERELYVMANLLEGYRKALKETHKAFAEYRARCPQPDEPLYKDVIGGGGLVLSTMELEKQFVKQEEERRKLEEEMKKQEEKMKQAEEMKKQEEEKMKQAEEVKKQEEEKMKQAEEMEKQEEGKMKREEEKMKLEEERMRQEGERIKQEEESVKLEEEEAMNRSLIEKNIKAFEVGWITNFEAHNNGIHMLTKRMLDVENEVKHLKELHAKREVSETSTCAATE